MSFRPYIRRIFSRPKVLALMYHRIADLSIDPWDLAVSKNNFEQHLAALGSDVISVKELISQLNSGHIEKDAVCLTFDDGYTDNYVNAAPLLEKYRCPATFFIPTNFIDSNEIFWWDALTDIFLKSSQLPPTLQLDITGAQLNFSLENGGAMNGVQIAKHRAWRWPSPPPTQRCAIYLAIWELIRELPAMEIKKIIHSLIEWSGFVSSGPSENFPMTSEELRMIADDSLFSLGAHTMSHPALGAHDRAIQQAELKGARDNLARRFNNYINAVAYPYGHYNEDTIGIMQTEHFEAGFTTNEKPVTSFSNMYQLGRMKVANLSGKEFSKQLVTWFRQ